MRQNTNGAGETEQTTRQRRWKTQLAKDDGGCTVDVHGNRRTAIRANPGLHGRTDLGELPCHCACCGRFLNQRHQSRRARVRGFVKSVTEPGDDLTPFTAPSRQGILNSAFQIRVNLHVLVNAQVKLRALFARAAMHIAEHVYTRCHHRIEANTARGSHARCCNGRRLRAVINASDQGCLQQVRLRLRRQVAARHEPDHLCKPDVPDKLFDGMSAKRDAARRHVDDRRAPPVSDRICIFAHRASPAGHLCCPKGHVCRFRGQARIVGLHITIKLVI